MGNTSKRNNGQEHGLMFRTIQDRRQATGAATGAFPEGFDSIGAGGVFWRAYSFVVADCLSDTSV
jgi:hypothetical protein